MAGNINVLRSPTSEKKIPLGNCAQQSLFKMALDGLASLGDSKWKLSTEQFYLIYVKTFCFHLSFLPSHISMTKMCVYIYTQQSMSHVVINIEVI